MENTHTKQWVPGRTDHVPSHALCVVLCVVLIIRLLLTRSVVCCSVPICSLSDMLRLLVTERRSIASIAAPSCTLLRRFVQTVQEAVASLTLTALAVAHYVNKESLECLWTAVSFEYPWRAVIAVASAVNVANATIF